MKKLVALDDPEPPSAVKLFCVARLLCRKPFALAHLGALQRSRAVTAVNGWTEVAGALAVLAFW
jgi:hypothetical protein